LDEKLALVEASMAPAASIGEVARAADIDVSLVYKWRRMFVVKAPERRRAPPHFAEVAIKPQQPDAPVVDKAIVIELPRAKLRIPPGALPELLQVILRELLA
jgi:transposase